MRKKESVVYLPSVRAYAFPEGFQDTVEGLDAIRGCSFCQRGQCQSSDGPDFLLFIYQTCKTSSLD